MLSAVHLLDIFHCKCLHVKLNFSSGSFPLIAKAKVYYLSNDKRQDDEDIYERLTSQADDIFGDNFSSQSEWISGYLQTNYLNFSTAFSEAVDRKKTFVDVEILGPLPIVMVQVIYSPAWGNMTRVSGGLHGNSYIRELWVPEWTKTVENGFFLPCGKAVSTIFSLNDLSFNHSFPLCDTLRLEFAFAENLIRLFHEFSVQRISLKAFDETIPVGNVSVTTKPNFRKAVVNLPVLPFELWEKIVQFIDNKLQALVALSGTCREWRRLFSLPNFYKSVDFTPCATYVYNASSEFFDFLIQRAAQNVRHIRVSWVPSSPKLMSFGTFFNLIRPHQLESFVAEMCSAISDEDLNILVTTQRNMKTLKLSGCFAVSSGAYKCIGTLKCLQQLSLGQAIEGITADAVKPLIKDCPNLEVFQIDNVSLPNGTLQYNDLSSEIFSILIDLASSKSLKSLHIDLGNTSWELSRKEKKVSFIFNLLKHLQKIEEFYLSDCEKGFDGEILLQSLKLSENNMTLSDFCPMIRELSGIRCHCEFVDVGGLFGRIKFLVALANVLKGLNGISKLFIFIDLNEYNNIEWETDYLLESLPNLRNLIIWTKKMPQHQFTDEVIKRHPSCTVEFRLNAVNEDSEDRFTRLLDCDEGCSVDSCTENSFEPELASIF